jgi:GNAT superfamily N-acetyltransferase
MTAVIDVLPDQLTTVPATESVVRQLVLACSPAALQRRFFLSGPVAPEVVWARCRRYLLAGPPDGAAVVALAGDVPVGLLNLVVVGTGVLDMSLLVVDAWQRRGIASRLLESELGRPRWAGWTVTATVQPDNAPVRALLGSPRWGEWRVVDRDPSAWEYAMTLLG